MSTPTIPQQQQQQEPPPQPKGHRVLWGIGAAVAAGALIGIGVAIGSSGNSTKTVTVPGPTITQTVPGPETTVTVTASPPPPATGAVIATFKGHGTENTGPFTVPDSGNYLVSWSYSGNVDNSFGSSQATNFSIQNTGDGYGDLPNDIAASGHGSTEVTGSSKATESFNVDAVGSWTITVKAA